ncbi:hypothetical protein ACROYT_G037694 [Oculina patagonica]
MLRSFQRVYSSLFTLDGLLERRLIALKLQYLRTSSVNLRSIHNKDDDGRAISFNYKGKIPLDKLTVKYARSSGPGGQNVNKVNTKVDLRFHVLSAEWIPEDVRYKILEREKNRINKNGELFLSSMKTRSQLKNLEDAIQKVEMIIEEASYVPPETTPEKKAHVRKLIRADNEKRLRVKKYLSDKKRDRKQE